VAVAPGDDVPFVDVLSAADRALFRAKTEGRNRVCVQEFRRA
jgi:PleD family two-component response regulator